MSKNLQSVQKVIIAAITIFAGTAYAERCDSLENKIDALLSAKAYSIDSLRSLVKEIKKDPSCDDGMYAESIAELVGKIANSNVKDAAVTNLIIKHAYEADSDHPKQKK